MRRRTILALATVAFAAATLPGFAGAGGGKGAAADPSIALNESAPNLGGYVTFTAAYPSSVKTPRIEVMCYQDSVLVYGEAGSTDHAFLLGGAASPWLTMGGSATCTADLFYFKWTGGKPGTVMLASTSFDAAG